MVRGVARWLLPICYLPYDEAMNFRECATELRAAQRDFGIDDSLHTVQVVSNHMQAEFGFSELPLQQAPLPLFQADPHVRAKRVTRVLSLIDPDALPAVLPAEVRERVERQFSVAGSISLGPTKRRFGLTERRGAYAERVRQEHAAGRRVTVVFEESATETLGIGNFQVYGSQFLREYLWALTTIMPEDIGEPENQHFLRCASKEATD